jgi:UDP-N-acetyl-2-amino-2-deoxyglucuronate dehydrogenase
MIRGSKMSKKYNFAIIGCGVIANTHGNVINAIERANLYAVCDIIKDKADEFAKKYNADNVYYDYMEMLQDPNIDIVCICTPSGMHGEMAVNVANAGKHIVCEKPIEITTEKIKPIIEAVKRNNIKFQSIFQRRTMPAAIATKKLIEEGKLGKIVMANAYLKYYRDQAYYDSAGWRGTWELDGGGALMNQGVHGIDLLQWMVGQKVTSIFGRADHLSRNIEVEDTAVALLQFEGGGYGVIEGATTCYPGLDTTFAIHGEKGTIIFSDSGIERWDFIDEDIPRPDAGKKIGGATGATHISSGGHYILLNDLIDAIENDRQPMIPPEEGKVAVEIINSIYRSEREKKEVYL